MAKLKIYLVSRNDEVDYDEYNAAVVIAEYPEDAIKILKACFDISDHPESDWGKWDVSITEIIPTEKKVVCTDFFRG